MTTEVQIDGPADEIAHFRAAHITKDDEGHDTLDLDSIIAMPRELKNTIAGGDTSIHCPEDLPPGATKYRAARELLVACPPGGVSNEDIL